MPVLFNRPEDCCGCMACGNVCPKGAIHYAPDNYGNLYPQIDAEKCIECGLCNKVCDFQTENRVIARYPIKAFSGFLKNQDELLKSASGGAFAAIANYVLSKGGSIIGCIYDENLNAIHICGDKHSDIQRMQSSKYVQSYIGDIYKQVKNKLSEGKLVLFSGTPCQVAGLLSYLNCKTYDNLITIDLICHGAPNAHIWQQHLKYLNQQLGCSVSGVNFRSKKQGWGEMLLELTLKNNKTIKRVAFEDAYYRNFLQGNIGRPSAFVCKYAKPERVSDITIGDFWGHKAVKLERNNSKGLSVCTANTEKGLNYLMESDMILEEIPYETAILGNEQLRQPTPKGKDWDEIMACLDQSNYDKVINIHNTRYRKQIIKSKIKRYLPLILLKSIRSVMKYKK